MDFNCQFRWVLVEKFPIVTSANSLKASSAGLLKRLLQQAPCIPSADALKVFCRLADALKARCRPADALKAFFPAGRLNQSVLQYYQKEKCTRSCDS